MENVAKCCFHNFSLIIHYCIIQGHWIILDELNLAPCDVLEALNRLLDDNREVREPNRIHYKTCIAIYIQDNTPHQRKRYSKLSLLYLHFSCLLRSYKRSLNLIHDSGRQYFTTKILTVGWMLLHAAIANILNTNLISKMPLPYSHLTLNTLSVILYLYYHTTLQIVCHTESSRCIRRP